MEHLYISEALSYRDLYPQLMVGNTSQTLIHPSVRSQNDPVSQVSELPRFPNNEAADVVYNEVRGKGKSIYYLPRLSGEMPYLHKALTWLPRLREARLRLRTSATMASASS